MNRQTVAVLVRRVRRRNSREPNRKRPARCCDGKRGCELRRRPLVPAGSAPVKVYVPRRKPSWPEAQRRLVRWTCRPGDRHVRSADRGRPTSWPGFPERTVGGEYNSHWRRMLHDLTHAIAVQRRIRVVQHELERGHLRHVALVPEHVHGRRVPAGDECRHGGRSGLLRVRDGLLLDLRVRV